MIKVQRLAALAPPAWVSKAKDETKSAIAAYREAAAAYRKSKAANKRLIFVFNYQAYGDVLLRDAINKAYRYKCAYCESFFGATQPVAVEHYRPKGEVIEGKVRSKPGYYWLAATWENLLPSCTDCNSPRRQEVDSSGAKMVRGKGNHFPLVPGTKRARVPGKEQQEQPLLLHPEVDDPEDHLEFATEPERAGVIRAALRNGGTSEKGLASIEIYALDRPQLVQAREFTAKRLLSHLRNTRNSERRHREKPSDPDLKQEYDENLADLLDFLDSRQPYSAMAKQIAISELPGLVI